MQEMVAEGSNKLHFSIHQELSVIVKDELSACQGIIQVACDLEVTRGETEAWGGLKNNFSKAIQWRFQVC